MPASIIQKRVLILACMAVGVSSAQDSRDLAFSRKMLVEKTLGEARTHLEQNDFRKAVKTLERHLGIINGDRAYLDALKAAYAGFVRELEGTDQAFERATYQRRLSFLDPSFRQDSSKAVASEANPGREPSKAWSKVEGDLPEVNVGTLRLAALPGTPAGNKLISRGNIDDASKSSQGNPFSWANSQQRHDALTHRQLGDSAFSRRDYLSADSHFTKSWQTEPAMEPETRERWAYSRLHGILERHPGAESTPDLARELDALTAMAPRLKPQVDGFRASLRAGSSAGSQHLELAHRETNGWTTTATPSFRVHHHLDRTTGEKLARLLETTRAVQIEKWFGGEQDPWTPPCEVVIHDTAANYSTATGAPPTSPGHSTVKVEGGRVTQRRIDLHADDPNMGLGVLPHEATHIVMAGRFGTHLIPRWADEGMAVLAEPGDRIARHIHDLPRLGAQTGVFPIRALMSQKDYPEPRLMGVFYAQSVSVVGHMVELRGPRVFAAFLRDGLDLGYEQALARHYQANWDQLEASWRQAGSRQEPAVTASR